MSFYVLVVGGRGGLWSRLYICIIAKPKYRLKTSDQWNNMGSQVVLSQQRFHVLNQINIERYCWNQGQGNNYSLNLGSDHRGRGGGGISIECAKVRTSYAFLLYVFNVPLCLTYPSATRVLVPYVISCSTCLTLPAFPCPTCLACPRSFICPTSPTRGSM